MTIENDLITTYWIPLLFIILGIPLIFRKIPPNHVYGVRTKLTLSNKTIWYNINQYLGWYLLIAGIVLFIFRLLEPSVDFLKGHFKLVTLIVVVITFIIFIIHQRKSLI